jgi:hypothetical protein
MMADGIVFCEGVTNDAIKFREIDPRRVQSKFSYIAGKNIWISKGCTLLLRKKNGRHHIIQRCTTCTSAANNLSRWLTSEYEQKQKKASSNSVARSELDVARDSAFHVAVNAAARGEAAGFDYLNTYYRGLSDSGNLFDNYEFEYEGSRCFVIPCQGIPEQDVSDMLTEFSLDNLLDMLHGDPAGIHVDSQSTNLEISHRQPPLSLTPYTQSGVPTGANW